MRWRIGFVGSIRAASGIMERYLGYQRALRMAGIVPNEAWQLEDRDVDGKFIPLALPEELPEAFLCSCDEVAYNLVEALRRIGLRVPEDVAVCRLAQKIRQEQAEPVVCIIPGQLVVRESTGSANK